MLSSISIGRSILHTWLSWYFQEVNDQTSKVGNALTAEQQELRKQVKPLTMEHDILKKASSLLAFYSLNGYHFIDQRFCRARQTG